MFDQAPHPAQRTGAVRVGKRLIGGAGLTILCCPRDQQEGRDEVVAKRIGNRKDASASGPPVPRRAKAWRQQET
jgi:hypothetical protein